MDHINVLQVSLPATWPGRDPICHDTVTTDIAHSSHSSWDITDLSHHCGVVIVIICQSSCPTWTKSAYLLSAASVTVRNIVPMS